MNDRTAATSGTGRLPAEPFPRLGEYQLVKRLGLIGVAEVHLARRLGPSGAAEHVVLRRPRPDLSADPVAANLFAREARIAGLLQHPGIARLVDTIAAPDSRCICLEQVPGESLEKLLERRTQGDTFLAPVTVLLIARAVLESLEYGHGVIGPDHPHGIPHGDVCPGNIVITPDGAVKLLDFGLIKPLLRPSPTPFAGGSGYLSYAAPERLLRQGADGRADLWALGLTLFEALTNFRLFESRSKAEVKQAVLTGPIPAADALRPALPAAVTAIVSRALVRDVQQRYQSAAAMRADVEQALAAIDPEALGRAPARLRELLMAPPPAAAVAEVDGGHDTPVGVSPMPDPTSPPAPAESPSPPELPVRPARQRSPLAVAAVAALAVLVFGALSLRPRHTPAPRTAAPLAARPPVVPAIVPGPPVVAAAAAALEPVPPPPAAEPVAAEPTAASPAAAASVAHDVDAPARRTRTALRPLSTREAAVAFVRARSQLLGCFEQFSDSVRNDQGEITLSVVVVQSGAVREAAVTSPPAGSPALDACIVERARKLRFRPHPDREVRINVPFVYRVRD